tara:strand:- start:96 stop:344 length:249 start_codon:yes stop_codon:yes gene_type:complete
MFKKLEIKKAKDHYYIDSDTHFITDNFNKYGEAINDCPLTVLSHKNNTIYNKYHWEFDDYEHAKTECDFYNGVLKDRYKYNI